MKVILNSFLFTMLFAQATSVLAIDPHGGGGGNVCEYHIDKRRMSEIHQAVLPDFYYRTLDEAFYPDLAPSVVIPVMFDGLATTQNDFGIGVPINVADLTSTTAGHEVSKIFDNLSKVPGQTNFSVFVKDLYRVLNFVFVTYHPYVYAYGSGVERKFCSGLSAGIRTDNNMVTLLFDRAWINMPLESQKILLIHETLRLAQMFTPVLKDVSHLDLMKMTMLIYNGKPLKNNFYDELFFLNNFMATFNRLDRKGKIESTRQFFDYALGGFDSSIVSEIEKQLELYMRRTDFKVNHLYSEVMGNFRKTSKFRHEVSSYLSHELGSY